MSRVSQKSALSPSVTRGSNAIDLGKNSGVDMGRKAQPSVTSGGIGITQEVTNIAGVSVNAGVNVDITPVDFGISVSPSDGTISVATGAEIPGGLLGISGGIEIDANTGRITGGSIGGEALGLGINVSNSQKGGLGIEFTVQIPGTPISLSLGFGFPPDPKTPTPGTGTGTPGSETNWEEPILPPGRAGVSCTVVYVTKSRLTVTDRYNSEVPPSIYIYTASGSYKAITGSASVTATSIVTENGQPPVITTNSVEGGLSWKQGTGLDFVFAGPASGYSGSEVEIYKRLKGAHGSSEFVGPWYIYNSKWSYVVIGGDCSNSPPTSEPTPNSSPAAKKPFPNPPPRKMNMDGCCCESTKLLREIHKRLGISKFPGKLPETIIQETPEEGVEPAEPAQVPIEDFVDLLDWQFQRDDERWGKWQVELDIKDSDITQEGDQKKQIKLPNLAESVAEFQGQLLSIMTNVDALVALQIKTLAEAGMSRQEAIKGYLAAKAIIKYMAFKSSEIDVPVPMTFTAGAETISELLVESEGHIKGTEYAEKETLRDVQLDLLQAAAIIRAVHWQRFDTKSDTKAQLLSILKGSVDLAASIATKPQTQNEDGTKAFNPESNFEDFIDSVEDGFRNTTGVTDVQNPYGKPPNRRPRIKQIGDNISQAGVND